MEPEQRAEIEEKIAAVEEATEQRMHESAHLFHDSPGWHRRANRITQWAQAHLRRAKDIRNEDRPDPS